MTFATQFDNWQASPPPAQHSFASPNLRALSVYVLNNWPGTSNLGCYANRPVRGGGALSSHAYGAALDIGFPAGMNPIVVDEIIPFLIARSDELHVQAVHDYRRGRIWRAARTGRLEDACTAWWKAQRASGVTGMHQPWANHLHIESNASGWHDNIPVTSRWNHEQ